MVNWESEDFLQCQLRFLYESNPVDQFRIVVIDNSNELKRRFYTRYKNLEIWPRSQNGHGPSLDRVLHNANSEFLLTQDPDFFWLHKGHLAWLESFLENDVAVGAEYPGGVSVDGYDCDPTFPACWGCAFRLSEIKELSFEMAGSTETNGKDVGWRMRVALSGKPFTSFRVGAYVGKDLGPVNWSGMPPTTFWHENTPVAIHVMRGSYTKGLPTFRPNRVEYANHFYELACRYSTPRVDGVTLA